MAIRMRSGPILSPNLPNLGALISADTPGMAAIIPLIKAKFCVCPAKSRTNSVSIGDTDPVATWIINVVINRLNTSLGFSARSSPDGR